MKLEEAIALLEPGDRIIVETPRPIEGTFVRRVEEQGLVVRHAWRLRPFEWVARGEERFTIEIPEITELFVRLPPVFLAARFGEGNHTGPILPAA